MIIIENQKTLDNDFLENIIGKIFKILPLYEDFIEKGSLPIDKEPIKSYIDKVVILLIGNEKLYRISAFGEVAAILEGLQYKENLAQKEVKSIVFHCINILSKLQKTEV